MQPHPLALGRIACRAIGEPDRIAAICGESLAADIDRRAAAGEPQPQIEAAAVGPQPRDGAVEGSDIDRREALKQIGEAARRRTERALRAGEKALAGCAKEIQRGRAAAERGPEFIDCGGEARPLARERGDAQRLAIDDEAGYGRDRQNEPQE